MHLGFFNDYVQFVRHGLLFFFGLVGFIDAFQSDLLLVYVGPSMALEAW